MKNLKKINAEFCRRCKETEYMICRGCEWNKLFNKVYKELNNRG